MAVTPVMASTVSFDGSRLVTGSFGPPASAWRPRSVRAVSHARAVSGQSAVRKRLSTVELPSSLSARRLIVSPSNGAMPSPALSPHTAASSPPSATILTFAPGGPSSGVSSRGGLGGRVQAGEARRLTRTRPHGPQLVRLEAVEHGREPVDRGEDAFPRGRGRLARAGRGARKDQVRILARLLAAERGEHRPDRRGGASAATLTRSAASWAAAGAAAPVTKSAAASTTSSAAHRVRTNGDVTI